MNGPERITPEQLRAAMTDDDAMTANPDIVERWQGNLRAFEGQDGEKHIWEVSLADARLLVAEIKRLRADFTKEYQRYHDELEKRCNRIEDLEVRIEDLQAEKAELLAALSKARTVIGSYWPLVGSESEPEKSAIEALNMIDAVIAKAKEGK